MANQDFRSKLLLLLFILAIILLASNILLKRDFYFSSSKEQYFDEGNIEQRFRNVLGDFSIGDKLIKETKIKDNSTGREIYLIKVQVPEDLTIPEILLDIYQTFRKDSLQLSCEEIVKDGKSVLTIRKGRPTVLKTEFNYARNVLRNKGSFALIVKDIDPENSADNELIESSTKFNLLLSPESKVIPYLDQIKENGKQFSILIDDGISEQKYRLAASFSAKRVTTVAQTLIKDFKGIEFFIIDDQSEFYGSKNRIVLEKELIKRNFKVFKYSDFIALNDDENLIRNFNEMIENLNKYKEKIILTNKAAYQSLYPEIQKVKKTGFRIVDSSALL